MWQPLSNDLELAPMQRRCLSALLTLAALSLPLAARASENYPAIVDRQLGVECPRPIARCRICHDSAAGGEGTANQLFAMTLKMDYGLSGGKAGRELAMALQQLPAEQDTDADGAPDKEELMACMNPSGPELSEGPGFGCVGQLAPAAPHTLSGSLAGWSLGLSWLLMRSAARRRQAR
ncbi:MAG TPA: hypothetical protein VJU61_00260 [Polyangiaceae bacterium]|nr:hypothetical protein [Polyangiaceae bacterium]